MCIICEGKYDNVSAWLDCYDCPLLTSILFSSLGHIAFLPKNAISHSVFGITGFVSGVTETKSSSNINAQLTSSFIILFHIF